MLCQEWNEPQERTHAHDYKQSAGHSKEREDMHISTWER
jgi:hypothetical protein